MLYSRYGLLRYSFLSSLTVFAFLIKADISQANLINPANKVIDSDSVNVPTQDLISNIKSNVSSSFLQELTVRIEGPVPSSGVIVGKNNDTYYVLTTRHSVESQSEYTVRTNDGRRHNISFHDYGTKVRFLDEGIDLAIVEFVSTLSYRVASLNAVGISDSMPVRVVGWPGDTMQNPGGGVIALEGRVNLQRRVNHEGGYQFAHSIITSAGMSGSGVFNASGHLIGIHGRRDISCDENISLDNCERVFNLNWAIPISTFLSIAFEDLKEYLIVIDEGPGGVTTGPGGEGPGGITTGPGGEGPGGVTTDPRSERPGGVTTDPRGERPGGVTTDPRGERPGGVTTDPDLATLSGQVILSRASNSTNVCIKFNGYPNGLPDGYQPYFTAWAPGGGQDIPMNYSSSAPCQGGYALSRALPSSSLGGTLSIHDSIGLVDYVLVGNFSAELGGGCSDVGRVLSSVINWQVGGSRESTSSSRIPIGGDYGWVCKP